MLQVYGGRTACERSRGQPNQVAAGHLCFVDECGGEGGYSVAALGAALVDAPIWTFWWD